MKRHATFSETGQNPPRSTTLALALLLFTSLGWGCSQPERTALVAPPAKTATETTPVVDLASIFGDVDIEAAFSSTQLPAPPQTPPPDLPRPDPPRTASVVVGDIKVLEGSVDPKVIRKDFRRRQGSLLRCYLKTLNETPTGQGKVVVQLTLDERGHVSEALIPENAMDSSLSACLLARLKRFRFPREPNPEGKVEVHLEFSPQ